MELAHQGDNGYLVLGFAEKNKGKFMSAHDGLDNDCIFYKNIRCEIPSFKIFEDDSVFSFIDINPVAPAHSLVIPKFHTPNIFEATDIWAAATVNGIQRLARAVKETLNPNGINISKANGPGAAQSVFHLHMHLVLRWADDDVKMNWGIIPGDMDAIGKLAEQIRKQRQLETGYYLRTKMVQSGSGLLF